MRSQELEDRAEKLLRGVVQSGISAAWVDETVKKLRATVYEAYEEGCNHERRKSQDATLDVLSELVDGAAGRHRRHGDRKPRGTERYY